jgi:hypothetical protein
MFHNILNFSFIFIHKNIFFEKKIKIKIKNGEIFPKNWNLYNWLLVLKVPLRYYGMD